MEGVAPIGEGNTGNLQTRTTEIGLVCALAVLGVETIEAVGIGLQTAIDLERELLVGGSDLQAALVLITRSAPSVVTVPAKAWRKRPEPGRWQRNRQCLRIIKIPLYV